MKRLSLLSAVALFALLAASAYAESAPKANDLTPLFIEHGVTIRNMRVVEVGGIVVIRGRADDAVQAATAADLARTLGYSRIANLVQVIPPPDDQSIERIAERELTIHRALDGCHFRVESHDGVVKLAGTVSHELQKDVAIALVRNIDGVKEVRSDLQR